MKTCLVIAVVFGLSLFGSAHADVTNLTATINGAQANAGAGTGATGTGSAVMSYNDATGQFDWDISWFGLTGPVTVAHFHGPANPDQNAGVQVNFAAISGSVSPSIGSSFIDAAQATDLLSDLWYINIHTSDFPGGEIRGQVVVEGVIPVEPTSWTRVKALYE